MGIRNAKMEPSVNELLETYSWPGNVRGLRNVMERALILSGGNPVIPAFLPKEILVPTINSDSQTNTKYLDTIQILSLAEMEKHHIQRVLTANNGNKTWTAKQLGITRLTLRNKIKQYALVDFMENL